MTSEKLFVLILILGKRKAVVSTCLDEVGWRAAQQVSLVLEWRTIEATVGGR
jgi:hypothetical protein